MWETIGIIALAIILSIPFGILISLDEISDKFHK